MSDFLWPHELQHACFPVLHYLPEFAQTQVHWVSDTIQPSHPVALFSPPPLPIEHCQMQTRYLEDFTDSSADESTGNAGDPGLIPGLRRSPGRGHGYPFQYSCLENPYGQRSLAGCSLWGHKESDKTEWLHFTKLVITINQKNVSSLWKFYQTHSHSLHFRITRLKFNTRKILQTHSHNIHSKISGLVRRFSGRRNPLPARYTVVV